MSSSLQLPVIDREAQLAPGATSEVQGWLDQISTILESVRADRTAIQSPLFPMEYTRLQVLDAWRRWPEMLVAIDQAVPADELGQRFRRPGLGVNATHFFCIACCPVPGLALWRGLGRGQEDDAWRAQTLMDFYRRTAGAWRADGFTSSFAAGGSIRPYGAAETDAIANQAETLDDAQLGAFRRTLAALIQYSFLLNIECRVGVGDTGPYPLANDRVMVIRELSDLAETWRPWSSVARRVRHDRLVIGLILRPGVAVRITDIATTFTTPGSLLDHVEAVSVFSADSAGELTPLDLDCFQQCAEDVRQPMRDLYRHLSKLSYSDKLAAGILVYFAMIRPWAAEAGLADSLDWSVPQAALPVLGELGIDYRPEERMLTW